MEPWPTSLWQLACALCLLHAAPQDCCEAVLKIAAFGLLGSQGYLSSYANLLDLTVVGAALLELAAPEADLAWTKSLRVVRCLRPVRMINRVQSLRQTMDAIVVAIPGALYVYGGGGGTPRPPSAVIGPHPIVPYHRRRLKDLPASVRICLTP